MNLLKDLLAKASPLPSITEAQHLYKDFVTVKFDPDRDDYHDIANKLMPVVVKTAYANLVRANKDPAELTLEAVEEATSELWSKILGFVQQLSDTEFHDYIRREEDSFPKRLASAEPDAA